MNTKTLAEVAIELAQIAIDIEKGNLTDAIEVARKLFDSATSLIPVEQQKQFLTEFDRTFTDLEVDVVEDMAVNPPKT